MDLCNSPDIFQEKINELFNGLDFVIMYIDDLLIISNKCFNDHIMKLDDVLTRLKTAGFKVWVYVVAQIFFKKKQTTHLMF